MGRSSWSGGGSDAQTPEELEAELARRKEKFKKEEKKPDYELYPPLAAPYPQREKLAEPEGRRDRRLPIKPGHWTTVGVPVRSNAADLLADVQLAAMTNPRTGPSLLGAMAFWLRSIGIAAVPKGQTCVVELPLFVPPAGTEPWVELRMVDRSRRREVLYDLTHLERLPPGQLVSGAAAFVRDLLTPPG